MKYIIVILILGLFGVSISAQNTSTKDSKTYIRLTDEVKGKRTVFTELEINASPEIVRAKFLEFEKWSEWNAVIPQISVKTGDIHNLETEPTLDLMLDFGRDGDPKKAPVHPKVTENSKEIFVWGFKKGIFIKAEHVFIFEPIDNGRRTHLIHYEKMNGLLKSFVMTKKTKANMTERYVLMNEALKKICE